MFVGKLDTFVALGVRGNGMIENCSFNLGEFYVKMGKTNRNLQNYKERIHIMEIIKNEFLHKSPVPLLVNRHEKKKGNGF